MSDKKLYMVLGAVVAVLALVALALRLFAGAAAEKTVTLYYVNPNVFKLEQRRVVIEDEVDVRAALELLFKGTEEPGLENLFPDGMTVLDVSIDEEEDELVVDLSSNFFSVNYGIDVNYLLVMSVVYTASDASGMERVRLLFDGQGQEFFHNGVYMADAFKLDPDVLK